MKRRTITNFARGMSDDRYGGSTGEFAFSKHFDILTYPRRLQPLRGMSDESVTNTLIAQMIVASNGLMYGVGTDPGNPTLGKLWKRSGYGASDVWASLTTNQLSGAAVNYDLLVDWPDAGNIRTIHWASNNLLVASDPAGGSSAATQALTFSSIGQGLVHPKTPSILYFPYRTATAAYIALINANATPFAGLNATAFLLPSLYRAYCLSYYGNYLAVPLTSLQGIGVNGSIVGLWNKDTASTLFDETIPWGAGSLQVLNNLGGVLVGISTMSANNAESFQDFDSVQIKIWEGGAEPTLIKELKVPYIGGGSSSVAHPRATINPRVNFIYRNRMYFSVNLVPGDGINPAQYGLWSVGRNKLTQEWTVVQERVATNLNTETGVIAAAISGDFASMAHTSPGTLTYSVNGTQDADTYSATSVYESLVNPEMEENDKALEKGLLEFRATFLPLPTGASVVAKYRVDSNGNDADWKTVYTMSTAGATVLKNNRAIAEEFTNGYNYEFRLESLGGAIITGFSYKYKMHES